MKQALGIIDFFNITRAWSLNLTFISVTIPTVFALRNGAVSIPLYLFSLFAAMIFHLAANCLNDYFDFINNVDSCLTPGSLGRSHPIFTHLLEPKELFHFGLVLLMISTFLGVIFAIFVSPMIGILLVIGIFFAVFYTAKPFGLKYVRMGELAMFLAFGPLLMEGAYCIQRKTLSWEIFYLSMPVGFLAAAVLLSNNLRDKEFDAVSGVKTLAISLGRKKSLFLYNALCFLSVALVWVYMIFNLLPYIGLLVFLSLPICLKNMREFAKVVPNDADIKTSRFVFFFCNFLIVSLLLSYVF